MVYKWETTFGGLNKVDPNKCGELFKELESKNALTAENLVEESRPEDALLHNCFEWDDEIAAEKFRVFQAGNIIRNLKIVSDNTPPVRAFLNVKTIGSNYESLEEICKSEIKFKSLLDQAKTDLSIFKLKYNTLKELQPVFEAIDTVLEN